MFGTLRYEPQCDSINFHAGPLATQHSACDNCRARKLKCGGQKSGCGRCKSAEIQCVYSESNGNSRRGKNVTASQAGKNAKVGATTTRSPKTRNTAVQCEPMDQVQGTVNRTRTHSLNSETMDEAPPVSENTVLSPFTSSMPPFDDESMASDSMFQDILTNLSPITNGDGFESPDFSTQSNFGDYDGSMNDLFALPELDSSSFETYDTMGPIISAEPMAKTSPSTSITSLATQQMQNDRLSSQGETQRRNNVYTEKMEVIEVQSPTIKTARPKVVDNHVSKPQVNPFTQILQDRSQCQGECRCLHLTLSLLEGFENRELATAQQSLDSTLANHKSALDHCISMVRCPSCSTRSDYMILLRVVSDKLITSYERIVANNTENLRGRGSYENDGESESTASAFGKGYHGGSNAYRYRALTFGCYKIEGPGEGGLIVCVLIALQLKQMFALLAYLQSIAEGIPGESQVSAVKVRRQRVRMLSEKIKKLAGSIGARRLSSSSPEE